MAKDAHFFKEHLSLIVLSVLKDRPMYGYELVQTVKARSGNLLRLREGVLYPVLHRLVDDGLLISEWGDSEKGPRRRYYSLTTSGRTAQRRHIEDWRRFVSSINQVVGVKICPA